MRYRYVLCAVSLAAFCSAVGVTQQQNEPLAEQQFKNIKSFKGEKASDVIPAMRFMSASLGVSCDFCHTDDRASDEKRPKDTAREMIAMQRDINQKNFEGRNQVTCATCHAGHTHPQALPPVTGIDVRPRRSSDVVASQVLEAYGKAVGSPSTQGVRLEGTTTSHGETAKYEALYSGENRSLVTHTAKGDQKQGFNGSLAWFTTPNGVQSVPLAYAEEYVRQTAIYGGVNSLPKIDNPVGGTAKIGDKDQFTISGTISGEQVRALLFFDKGTGLLTRAAYYYPSVLGSTAQIDDFSNYRRVGGVLLPTTVFVHSGSGDTTLQFKSIHEGSKIEPTMFDPPKG